MAWRDWGDSGAIIVGAGTATSAHARCTACTATTGGTLASSYGSRVNVQGWGEAVATLGFGDLATLPVERGSYTDKYLGSSAASAMVAGVVASLQSVRVSNNLSRLTPAQMRQLLIDTGTAQASSPSGHIGPFPHMGRALMSSTMGLATWDCNDNDIPDRCEGGTACCLTVDGPCEVITPACCAARGGTEMPYTKCKSWTCQTLE